MNFSIYHRLGITGHRDIDFVDIPPDTDTALYIDAERIALSAHPYAPAAVERIEDFFQTLCSAAERQDEHELYHLLSYGREPNETHLGLSTFQSCGRGTSPEILLPIVRNMIRLGLFDRDLVTQLGDLHLWTPNFGDDRLSDLTTNIIRDVLYDYTHEQYEIWDIPWSDECTVTAATWNPKLHEWVTRRFPALNVCGYQTILTPKCFVGKSLLSSPSELLQKYALRYRQQEHLDSRSRLCRKKTDRSGRETWLPPTKKDIRASEIRGLSEKAYLLDLGYRYPGMVNELHTDHRLSSRHSDCTISNYELDMMLYESDDIAG